MKRISFSMAAAAMLVFPVVLCSCSTSSKTEKKAESDVPRQETKKETPAEEVKAEPVLDNSKPEEKPAPAPVADKKAEPAPAPEKKKAEPAPAPEKKKAEPAPVVDKKAEPAPAPEKKKAELNPPVEHVVRTGDNLWNIARKYYGSGAKWKLIYEANKSAIKKQDFLEPGTVLVIPAAK